MTRAQKTSPPEVSIFEMVASPAASLSRRDAILAAATRLFLQQGYEKTSMDLVAIEAGVARRTLYNQFPEGKEELFRVMVERMWQSFPVLDILARQDAQSDTETGLRHIAEAVVAFWTPPLAVDFLRMIIAEGRHFPDLIDSFFVHGKIPAMRGVRDYIEQQAARGALKIADSERAARQFLGLIDEPLLWIRVLGREENHSPKERQSVIDEAVALFLGFYGKK